MGIDKKDLVDVALTVIVALCCPITILFPPFNEVLKNDIEDSLNNDTTSLSVRKENEQ